MLILCRHSSLCGFVALPCDASAAHPGQPPVCVRELQCPQIRRRIFWVQIRALFRSLSLAIVSPPPPVSCSFLRQHQFWSHHLPRSATLTFPIRRFPSITQCLSCPIFASHNTFVGNSIMMINEDSLSHAACNRTDTIFSNVTKPNFLSKLRQWLSPSSTSSPHFTRLSIFATSHRVHDLRCKTKKLTERWTVICDTYTCVLFSGNSKSSTLSFHFSHSHFHTTVGHVITLRWSLWNHFHSHTCLNHCILKYFRTRFHYRISK